ncbi:hypothetical protein [Aurantiacibacter sediminis]|uniref:Beta-carotene 15,15'-monooxygenase n=1 Tax=Aurantiacibacter sediminis TaxID=2793064 RepID=A0ABS0N3V6_9SPHN|nr:hypothetical protein [Aurantiacibacter sediminis]MBH5322642.1 hypothetical protein [Aurantiacibacter sediminis]
MASRPIDDAAENQVSANATLAQLSDPKRAIASPWADALLLWGAPLAVLALLAVWLKGTEFALGASSSEVTVYAFFFATLITYGHLVAVVPRAYLNQDVFSANRFRLTVVPVVLLTALAISPTVFIIAGVVAFFWDVHHSAMQTFGIARIYDFKAGNGSNYLRRTDLLLNWLLYVGPIFVGASFLIHANQFSGLSETPLAVLATAPGYLETGHGPLRNIALSTWAIGIVWATVNYSRAKDAGYSIPPQKVGLIASTGVVTFLAWGFLPPLIAFATINIHHAVQYYVIVWVQEGKRITAFTRLSTRAAFAVFLLFTAFVALGYNFAGKIDSRLALVPFLACSLLHFWYDGFVWSVRKKSV